MSVGMHGIDLLMWRRLQMLSDILKCKDVQTAEVFLKELEKNGAGYLIFGAGECEIHCCKFCYRIFKDDINFDGTIEIKYYRNNNVIKIFLYRDSSRQIIIKEIHKINEILSLIEKVYDETIDRNNGELKKTK